MTFLKFGINGCVALAAVLVCFGGCSETAQFEKNSTDISDAKILGSSVAINQHTAPPKVIALSGDMTDDECCTELGQTNECWNQDAQDDQAVITCTNDANCSSDDSKCVDGRCTCTTDDDCDVDGACSESGICGPSWCNGYLICSCWGGCEWWHSSNDRSMTPDVWAASLKDKYCCEGNYPEGGDDPNDIVSGYLSNNANCGSGCSNDDDCAYLKDECRYGECNIDGICVSVYEVAGTYCGNDHAEECQNHDICDSDGNCILNYVAAGTECTTIDPAFNTTAPTEPAYYSPDCYTGFCGVVTPNLATLTNDYDPLISNGRCEPGIVLAENNTCEELFDVSGTALDTGNVGYLGEFPQGAFAFGEDSSDCDVSAGCLTASGSTLCAASNYQAGGDDCGSLGVDSPDLVYAFQYQANAVDEQELYGYMIQVEANFDVNVYVAQNIETSTDCPAGVDVDSNRCLVPYSGAPVWEDQVNTIGNEIDGTECCPENGTDCYSWCVRNDWSIAPDPVPCRDDDLDGVTTCNRYTAHAQGNMATSVIHPKGRTDDTATPAWHNVFVFIDSSSGDQGDFTITVERRKWDAGPVDRVNDDPKVYDVTGASMGGSVYLGNLSNSVNSRHEEVAGPCAGWPCSDNSSVEVDWLPTDLGANLLSWHDASDVSTISDTGGTVTVLADKAGSQDLTASGDPQTGSRFQNGLNVIDCDGSDYFSKGSFPVPSSGDIAIFSVMQVDAIDYINDSVFSMNSAANDFQLASNSMTQFNGQINVSGAGSSIVLTGGPYAGPSIYNTNFDFAGAAVYNAFIDGTQRAVNTAYITKLDASQTLGVFRNRVASNYPAGFVAEVIITEDVTAATRQKIEGYLAWKWGLEGQLPAAHPYKAAAPTISSAGDSAMVGVSSCHEVADASRFWPNSEYFKIHVPETSCTVDEDCHTDQTCVAGECSGAITYCVQTDESIASPADLVLEVFQRSINGSGETISPVSSGKYAEYPTCVHDNSSINAMREVVALPGVLYLVGVSQHDALVGSAPCSGNCNYKLIVTPGECPQSNPLIECNLERVMPVNVNDLSLMKCSSSDVDVTGIIEIGSGTPQTRTFEDTIEINDDDCFDLSVDTVGLKDHVYILKDVGDFNEVNFTLQNTTAVSHGWMLLTLAGCLESDYLIKSSLPAATVTSDSIIRGTVAARNYDTFWPVFMIIQRSSLPAVEPQHYTLTVTWN